jgi:hypothetical protein
MHSSKLNLAGFRVLVANDADRLARPLRVRALVEVRCRAPATRGDAECRDNN